MPKESILGFLSTSNEEQYEDILMRSYEITGTQFETYCNFKVHQTFVNEGNEPIEVCYTFSNDSKFCIYDSCFIINGDVIKPIIMVKEEAEVNYEYSRKDGLIALYGEGGVNGLSIFKIGNVQPGKEVEVIYTLSFVCMLHQKGSTVKFPLQTKFPQGTKTTVEFFKICSFRFELVSHHFSGIEEVNVNCEADVTKRENSNTATISISEYPCKAAILIDIEYEDPTKSFAISSDNLTLISPFISAAQSSSKLNNEYIFLIDCSGSRSAA